MNYAIEHNLPIFNKSQVFPYNDKYYINAKVGYHSFLGCMNTTPRKDFYAFVDKFNEKEGLFNIGRLDSIMINKYNGGVEIMVEVIPNKNGSIIYTSEFVPKLKGGYLPFISPKEMSMSFLEWIKFMNDNG